MVGTTDIVVSAGAVIVISVGAGIVVGAVKVGIACAGDAGDMLFAHARRTACDASGSAYTRTHANGKHIGAAHTVDYQYH
jgi:hypothetical protein